MAGPVPYRPCGGAGAQGDGVHEPGRYLAAPRQQARHPRRLRRADGPDRSCCVHQLHGAHQREHRRTQPAADPHAGRRPSALLCDRSRPGPARAREVVAGGAAHWAGDACRAHESRLFQRLHAPFQLKSSTVQSSTNSVRGFPRMSFSRKFKFARRALPALLSTLLATGVANAFTPFVVKDIQVNGVQRVDPGTVFTYLPVRVGETFTEEQAAEAIQRLYSSGLFSDVKIDTTGDVLVVSVQERPTIASVSFNGMREFDDKAIIKSLLQVGFGTGRVFDRSMLERAEFELKQQYLSKGKYGVEITPVITPLPRNRVGVAFDIFEGDLARIKEINIVGNQAFSQGTLLDELELTDSGLMTWYTGTDKYSREKLEGDMERLRSFYLDRGYLEYSADAPQ